MGFKKREREIEFERIERIKKHLSFGWKEIWDLLNISESQFYRYKACGRLPASRYYAAKDALLLHVEEKAREEREKIMRLFNTTD